MVLYKLWAQRVHGAQYAPHVWGDGEWVRGEGVDGRGQGLSKRGMMVRSEVAASPPRVGHSHGTLTCIDAQRICTCRMGILVMSCHPPNAARRAMIHDPVAVDGGLPLKHPPLRVFVCVCARAYGSDVSWWTAASM